ncbi:FAD-dependent oxidoreductase [Trueperella sp. LYQ141]|uniref:FAD-dependent oxidoreductase n=1 Tax=Trueperella sp. LYQ141 TaxID=3391058 RepID=UPI003983A06B
MAEEVDFDVIIIGAGVAGSVCAKLIADQGHEVLLVERGNEPGSKNLSGGIFYSRVIEEIFPNFADVAPVERRITRNCIHFINETSSVGVDYYDQRLGEPVNAVSVLRARLDPWLAEQAENSGVTLMPGFLIEKLIVEDGVVKGIEVDGDEIRARMTIAADGVNSFVARSLGMRQQEKLSHLAIGVKSVIGLPKEKIEERFHLSENDGVAYAMVGDCTQGIGGGAFLYTNTESISLGVVLRLDDLVASGKSASDIHDYFLSHPTIKPLIKGGDLLEYGSHLTIENGPAMVKQAIARPGILLIGDAAGFTLNTGLTIRGMDLATESARCAAKIVNQALTDENYTEDLTTVYRQALADSFLGQDMATYQRTPAFLENERMYKSHGKLAVDIFNELFTLDTTPRKRAVSIALRAIKRSGIGLLTIAKDAWHATRAL